jgi:hypothetical protein
MTIVKGGIILLLVVGGLGAAVGIYTKLRNKE